MSVDVNLSIDDIVTVNNVPTIAAHTYEDIVLSTSEAISPVVNYFTLGITLAQELDSVLHEERFSQGLTISQDVQLPIVFIDSLVTLYEFPKVNYNLQDYSYYIQIADVDFMEQGRKRLNVVTLGYEGTGELKVRASSSIAGGQGNRVERESRTGRSNVAFVNLSGENFDLEVFKEKNEAISIRSINYIKLEVQMDDKRFRRGLNVTVD